MDHILKCHDLIPMNLVRGENACLYDDLGKRYVDFESGCWAAALGHNHPRIQRVMKDQTDRVIHLGTRYPNALTEAAAIDVLEIVGIEDGKCVFLSSGSEAVELGAQIARRVTDKPLLLTFPSSYLAAFGSAGRKSPDEWCLFDWNLCTHAGPCGCLNGLPWEDIGGFVFEPGGSGSEAVRFPSQRLVQEIVARVRQQGGLLMANEITTGLGRTGKWFGFQHYDVQPDIVALGKGLGNGYPVSAVTMRRTVAEKIEASGFHYAQSHQNDPLGCAVAREVIAVLKEENWVERGNATGAYFLKGLKRLAEKHAVVKEVRGRGMLLALEFCSSEDFSVAAAFQSLLRNGFFVACSPARNFLRFDPCLTMERKDIDDLLACLDGILAIAGKP
jgi:acetylornithine/N-succinyldiaminopimelate aminotransferase